ncbi:hypothetical protein JHK84_048935 [Glycine max]|uniref:Protein terminal ear1 isoform A n=1 Tax=Glycine soja TaxID=3848 RepID=A0A445FMM5_GLYSO|nr:protein terminal ear1-like isoform X1 [Glycine soja]KAG4920092.1 hypothetical protein JHK86_048905 [Glycine max]KAG4934742.1 hypothetical protein JHK85_049661 [Glycine max]KAG5093347.1 hypothetical protein JHK84_048935 [Glycine max]RZB50136.1 Protein terminal ear1 isoform A [Glycine soja]
MGETGIIVSFQGNLDPRAEEFRPLNLQCQWYPLPLPTPLSTSSTRSLLLTPLPFASHSALRAELQAFGDIRALQTDSLRHGILTVHFFDLRHAESAFAAIRSMHLHFPQFLLSAHPISAHYVLPSSNAFPDAHNQGTLVIFNLHPNLSTVQLRRLFQPFGPIKELRDTPWKKNQRFVEFFDIRDAAKALKHMNGKEIHGKQVVIEFSRPGGHTRKFFHHSPPSETTPFNVPPPPPPFPPSPRRRFAAPRLHSSQKKSPGSHKSTGSIDAEMGSMSLTGEVEVQHSSHGPTRRNLSRKHNCDTTVVVGTTTKQQQQQQQQQQVPRSRHWKGKQAKKQETRFLIKEGAIVESGPKDTRTTVMIKNIPNKYSQKLLLNMLDNHCRHCNEQIADGDEQQPLSSYDFVYLPIDFNNKCNVGYGFVNMTSTEATLRLHKAFHLQHWEVFNSRKICEVTYARVQGLEALKEHFKNSKFPCEMEHYLPVVFSPPRDGKELTEPLPIVGNKQQQQAISSGGGGSGSVGDDDETNEEVGSSVVILKDSI